MILKQIIIVGKIIQMNYYEMIERGSVVINIWQKCSKTKLVLLN